MIENIVDFISVACMFLLTFLPIFFALHHQLKKRRRKIKSKEGKYYREW